MKKIIRNKSAKKLHILRKTTTKRLTYYRFDVIIIKCKLGEIQNEDNNRLSEGPKAFDPVGG